MDHFLAYHIWKSLNEEKSNENIEILGQLPFSGAIFPHIKGPKRGSLKTNQLTNDLGAEVNGQMVRFGWNFSLYGNTSVYAGSGAAKDAEEKTVAKEKTHRWHTKYSIFFYSEDESQIPEIVKLLPKTISFKRREVTYTYNVSHELENAIGTVFNYKSAEHGEEAKWADYHWTTKIHRSGSRKAKIFWCTLSSEEEHVENFTAEEILATEEFKALNVSCVSSEEQLERKNLALTKKFDLNDFIPSDMITGPLSLVPTKGAFFYSKGAVQWTDSASTYFRFNPATLDGWKEAFKKFKEKNEKTGKTFKMFPEVKEDSLIQFTNLKKIDFAVDKHATIRATNVTIPDKVDLNILEEYAYVFKDVKRKRKLVSILKEVPVVSSTILSIIATAAALKMEERDEKDEWKVYLGGGNSALENPKFNLTVWCQRGIVASYTVFIDYEAKKGQISASMGETPETIEFAKQVTSFSDNPVPLKDFTHNRRGKFLIQDLGVGD